MRLDCGARVGGIGASAGRDAGGSDLGSGAGAASAGDAASRGRGAGRRAAEQRRRRASHPGLVPVTPNAVGRWPSGTRGSRKMLRSGELARPGERAGDAVVEGRTQQRLTQAVQRRAGVRRRSHALASTAAGRSAIFGALYADIALDPVPALTTADAAAVFEQLAGGRRRPSRTPELMVLPTDDGELRARRTARASRRRTTSR